MIWSLTRTKNFGHISARRISSVLRNWTCSASVKASSSKTQTTIMMRRTIRLRKVRARATKMMTRRDPAVTNVDAESSAVDDMGAMTTTETTTRAKATISRSGYRARRSTTTMRRTSWRRYRQNRKQLGRRWKRSSRRKMLNSTTTISGGALATQRRTMLILMSSSKKVRGNDEWRGRVMVLLKKTNS